MDKNQMPFVSVSIPCYNTGEVLRETLDSVLAQTYPNLEVVCVDDLSGDETFSILQEYRKRYPDKIRVVQNWRDEGGQKARKSFNLCVENCRGDYIRMIGHDDLLSPDSIERDVKRVLETDADCILGRVVQFKEDCGRRIWEKVLYEGFRGNYQSIISGREATALSLDWQIHSWGFWRASVIRAVPLNEEEIVFDLGELEDRKRFLLCKTVAFSAGTYYYRVVQNSITHKPYGRYTHTRLTTNREVLAAIESAGLPQQCIDTYRIATYRMMCTMCSRFFISRFYWNDREGRRAVWRELKNYYRDSSVINRRKLIELCPTFLDWFRLHFFWSVVPITFWRKFLNKIFSKRMIF